MSDRILFRNVSHCFGHNQVLSAAGLGLEKGKATLLAGPNGSGKTTFMRIMAGLLAPTNGRVAIGDRILTWRQARKTLLAHTVYLHQEPYMFDASVEENVAFPLRARRAPDLRQRAGEALELARLTDQARQPAKSLSGGERRRLAIARAWLTGVEFMLLDEPTANLDTTARTEAVALMRELHGAGIGLVVASHMPEEVVSFADETVDLAPVARAPVRPRRGREVQPPTWF